MKDCRSTNHDPPEPCTLDIFIEQVNTNDTIPKNVSDEHQQYWPVNPAVNLPGARTPSRTVW